jgi:hypothetical protein
MLFDPVMQEKLHKEQTYDTYRSTSKVSHMISRSTTCLSNLVKAQTFSMPFGRSTTCLSNLVKAQTFSMPFGLPIPMLIFLDYTSVLDFAWIPCG